MEIRGTLVVDTSVIIEGIVSKKLKSGELSPAALIVPHAVLSELERQANSGQETGLNGLDELKRLREFCSQAQIPFLIRGPKVDQFAIDHARDGAIDDIIRDVARSEDATLVSADQVQALVAEASGVPVLYYPLDIASKAGTALDEFFTETAMSVHLKEGAAAVRKVGKPGEWRFETIPGEFDRSRVMAVAKSIVEQAGARRDSYIEKERRGSTILQLGSYRCVIAKPPFASAWEITAVRPVTHLTLDEYNLSEKLLTRLAKEAEGILVAGAPGSGKSTFVQALTAFYVDQQKIVKTVEAPRDLVVPKAVTQYSLSNSTAEEIRDVLLLNRPDYAFFDEMRNNDHFALYSDLRLSGVGMVGVVHATKPIDAIQRFMSRTELGVIPHIVDTVIFIKAGGPKKIFTIEIRVKVPSGMTEEDLARPVVCISDFETGKLEYEVYTFGEQTMVLPVSETEKSSADSPVLRLAGQSVKEYFEQFTSRVQVEMLSATRAAVYVPKDAIAGIIGSGGKHIQSIEQDLGITIDVRERGDKAGKAPSRESRGTANEISFDIEFGKKDIITSFGKKHSGIDVTFYDNQKAVCTGTVDKKGTVRIRKDTPQGVQLGYALKHGELTARSRA